MRIIKNTELATKILEALENDTEYDYEEVTHAWLLVEVDKDRPAAFEAKPIDDLIVEDYIRSYKQELEEQNY